MKRLARFISCFAVASCAAAPFSLLAQTFPTKLIRIIVPYEPGGSLDLTSRSMAEKMSEELGQSVIVENRGGASGQIGTQQVARSTPDGHTILVTVGGTHYLSQFTMRNLPYHPIRDFTPITAAVSTITCIAANLSFPPNSARELIEYAKRNPGKLSYGSSGVGADTHLAMEEIRLLTGAEMVHVPYKGGGPLTVALLGGQVPVGSLPLAAVMQQVRTGKLKVIALYLTKRYAAMPDVSTVVEAVPGYENPEAFTAVLGPLGVPSPVVRRLHGAIAKGLNSPEIRKQLEARGQMVLANTPEEFAVQIKSLTELAERLVKAAGIRPE